MTPTHLIVGCGYLGSRVAKLWQAEGFRVAALTRSREKQFQEQGLIPIGGDVNDAKLNLPEVETVLYAVGMDRSSGRSFREVYLDGLRNVLNQLPTPRRFIYISSTSVYGQSDGSWVDESSPTEPVEENGKIILEAEQMLRSINADATILRFAGIYGPDRILRRAALERGEPLMGDAEKWLNLIHVEDGARIVLAAERKAPSGSTFLVSDGHPVRRREFYTHLATLLQAPPAQFAPLPPEAPLPPHERGNRRVSNQKLREELDVTFDYFDYIGGLAQSLRASRPN
jgi:nucleoside-diphosphate-sugar epimerase